jgi:hypothetical protein
LGRLLSGVVIFSADAAAFRRSPVSLVARACACLIGDDALTLLRIARSGTLTGNREPQHGFCSSLLALFAPLIEARQRTLVAVKLSLCNTCTFAETSVITECNPLVMIIT